MSARIEVEGPGGPEVMALTDGPVPDPGPGEVRIRVHAAGVNFIDTYRRSGVYPMAHPYVPGSEAAGVIEALGDGVSGVHVGDRVATAEATGTYAEHALVRAETLLPVPDGVDMEVAAALPLQGLTAHYLATSSYPAGPGDRALVHAGAGGVGLLLTQLLVDRGVEVITTVSTEEKAALSRAAGATHVLFGGASGQVPPFDLQRLNSGGSVSVTRPTLAHFLLDAEERRWRAGELFAAVLDGSLDVRVGATYPLADAARAHEDLEARRTTGSIVLIP
ncbi:quinone oxidoreductase family protein [Clavibacter michiganensis]|uniref:quinone oxidoreductase family protein n=1 Tax=Clavibacter michiganensis TaxID=28447 RepID=UPI0026DDC69C|nr:quinone oxidoreductase [Clavibacter michiganensis]MDO4044651.1 quinone oxidoreductase [Clavibacter michiganensis]MDO4054125.1 quinone oxidoreductase [Clavibacter michiganensis]MDO4056963.1 quinone oxidoreductase [Clavibacter michiganensis]MDO4069546.1 quinone oxidoreductase [Clavibacter michiganensis]